MKPGLIRQIILVGIIAGLADITGATVSYMLSGGTNPIVILKYIASGVYGKEAFDGGAGMATLGFLFHMFNAMAFTVFFFLIYSTLRKVTDNAVVLIVFYGAFVWCVMNLLVVPMSNVSRGPLTFRSSMIQMGILIICIGIPVVIGTRRFYSDPAK